MTFHIPSTSRAGRSTNRIIPRRLGFLNETELEFFELFCTVDKIGAKKALKAMGRPIQEMADAIQRQDAKWLTTMPGIGKQSAEQIIATLKRKVTRFAMAGPARDGVPARGRPFPGRAPCSRTRTRRCPDARHVAGGRPDRLDAVAAGGKSYKTAEDVINVIFRKE